MKYTSDEMELAAVLDTAQLMCAAARTAPKTRGIDNIVTMVLTGEDKDALAGKMEEVDARINGENRTFLSRDAGNLRKAQAVVLVGVKDYHYGLDCGYCGFKTCMGAEISSTACCFGSIDLGVAVGSAVSTAAAMKADCRVMFSVGKCAAEMGYIEGKVTWLGIPLSVAGKNIFFDRK